MKRNTCLLIVLALVIGALASFGVAWLTGLNHHASADLQSSPLFEQSRASAVSELEGETDPNNPSAPPQAIAPAGQGGPVVPQMATMAGYTCGGTCGATCKGGNCLTYGNTCPTLSGYYTCGLCKKNSVTVPDFSHQTSTWSRLWKWKWVAIGTLGLGLIAIVLILLGRHQRR